MLMTAGVTLVSRGGGEKFDEDASGAELGMRSKYSVVRRGGLLRDEPGEFRPVATGKEAALTLHGDFPSAGFFLLPSS